MGKVISPYKAMPKAVAHRSGCKVSWDYYKDEATARKAAVIARHNGDYGRSQGYDFGYCSPGSVEHIVGPVYKETNPHYGLWEVCTF